MMTHVQAMAGEAQRRLKLLGATKEDTTGSLLGVRARQVGITVAVLRQWHACYLRGGLDAPLPETKSFIELQKRSKERKILSGTTIIGT